MTTQSEIDIISALPLELSSAIFRRLDTESLVNSILVSNCWKKIVMTDPLLKRRLRRQMWIRQPTFGKMKPEVHKHSQTSRIHIENQLISKLKRKLEAKEEETSKKKIKL